MLNSVKYYPAIISLLLMAACGYRLGSGPVDVPGGVKSVAVPVFDNLTREPELGVVLAEAMRTEILRRGAVALKPAAEAEAILRGRVEEVKLSAVSFDEIGYASAYMVTLKASVQLERHGDVIWSAENVERFEQILTTNQPLDNRVRRQFALEKTASDLTEQIHTMMIEGF